MVNGDCVLGGAAPTVYSAHNLETSALWLRKGEVGKTKSDAPKGNLPDKQRQRGSGFYLRKGSLCA